MGEVLFILCVAFLFAVPLFGDNPAEIARQAKREREIEAARRAFWRR